MINKTFYTIFQKGSRTYFYSSIFFPPYIKKDVFTLYGFVRKVDNYVDSIPQNIDAYYEFKKKYYNALDGRKSKDIVIDSFVELMNNKEFELKWIDSFFESMEMDIIKKRYDTLDETKKYIHGSAEVIGLMMAKIMDLPKESFIYSKYLGRAMQYINFIRDISEDLKLGRIYFPSTDLNKHGLIKLDFDYIQNHKNEFSNFINEQLNRYCKWQNIAEIGYKYIPKRYLISVKTASEMYNWAAQQINSDPMIIYTKKVKPIIMKIISTTILNLIDTNKNNYTLKPFMIIKPTLTTN
jgi:phytoene synthase